MPTATEAWIAAGVGIFSSILSAVVVYVVMKNKNNDKEKK